MPIYKGFSYVLLAHYAEEIENGCFKIKHVNEISEQDFIILLLSERMQTCLRK